MVNIFLLTYVYALFNSSIIIAISLLSGTDICALNCVNDQCRFQLGVSACLCWREI